MGSFSFMINRLIRALLQSWQMHHMLTLSFNPPCAVFTVSSLLFHYGNICFQSVILHLIPLLLLYASMWKTNRFCDVTWTSSPKFHCSTHTTSTKSLLLFHFSRPIWSITWKEWMLWVWMIVIILFTEQLLCTRPTYKPFSCINSYKNPVR